MLQIVSGINWKSVDKLFQIRWSGGSLISNFATYISNNKCMKKKYTLLLFFFMFVGLISASAQNDTSVNDNRSEEKMDNFIFNESVRMYPNPVETYLTIQSTYPITRIVVYSLLGDRVKVVRSNFSRIDLRNLNSGIYMIKIHSNQFSVTKKLVKK